MTTGVVDATQAIATTERWFAHMAAGCVASVPCLETKRRLAHDAYAAIERAARIDAAAAESEPVVGSPMMISDLYRTRERLISAALETVDGSQAGRLTVNPRLVPDATLRQIDARCGMAKHWWPSRIDRPTRSADLEVGEPGARREEPHDPYSDPAGIGLMLHSELNAEYTTMELMTRCSFEFADLPLRFHRRLLRQGADEARHAELVETEMRSWGMRYGDVPVSTSGFELNYAWPDVEAGSLEELLNRMLLRSSIQEALSLDHLEWQIRVRDHLGQPTLCTLFDKILADETHHVRNGFSVSVDLGEMIGCDLATARAAARQRYLDAEQTRREGWLATNWQAALVDLSQPAPNPVAAPLRPAFNADGRRDAGFPSFALAQDLDWAG